MLVRGIFRNELPVGWRHIGSRHPDALNDCIVVEVYDRACCKPTTVADIGRVKKPPRVKQESTVWETDILSVLIGNNDHAKY